MFFSFHMANPFRKASNRRTGEMGIGSKSTTLVPTLLIVRTHDGCKTNLRFSMQPNCQLSPEWSRFPALTRPPLSVLEKPEKNRTEGSQNLIYRLKVSDQMQFWASPNFILIVGCLALTIFAKFCQHNISNDYFLHICSTPAFWV